MSDIANEVDQQSYICSLRLPAAKNYSEEILQKYFADARLKLAAMRASNVIASFLMFDSQFERSLAQLCLKGSERELLLPVGAGIPDLPGLSFSHHEETLKTVVLIEIDQQQEQIARWSWQWLETALQGYLSQHGLRYQYNAADLFAWWYGAAFGAHERVVDRFKIPVVTPVKDKTKIYDLIVDASFYKVDLHIYDVARFRELPLENILQQAEEIYLQKFRYRAPTCFYRVLSRHVQHEWRQINQGYGNLAEEFARQICLVLNVFIQNEMAEPRERIFPVLKFLRQWRISQPVPVEEVATALDLRLASGQEASLVQLQKKRIIRWQDKVAKFNREFKSSYWSRLQGQGQRNAAIYDLNLAEKALLLPEEKRSFQALTLLLNDSYEEPLLETIFELMDELIAYTKQYPAEDQYMMNIQLLPLTLLTPSAYRAPALEELDATEHPPLWLNCIVRELINLYPHKDDQNKLLNSLAFTLANQQIAASIQQLVKAKFIKYDDNRRHYVVTQKNILSGDSVAGEAINQYHAAMLELARRLYNEYEPERKYFYQGFLSFPAKHLGKVVEIIHGYLQQEFELTKSTHRPNQLYQLNTQLFVLTK